MSRARWLEPLKSVALVLLLAASLLMSGALWIVAPPRQAATGETSAVRFGDAGGTVPGTLLAPEELVYVGTDSAKRWTDRKAEGFSLALDLLDRTVAALPPDALEDAPTVAISARSQGAPEAPGAVTEPLDARPRLEAVFAYPVPWSVWYTEASGGACTSGDGPRITRVAIAAQGEDAVLAAGSGETFYRGIVVPGLGGEVREALAALAAVTGEPVAALAAPAPWSTLGSVWVPLGLRPALELAVSNEFIEQGRALPAAFFRDIGAVRRIEEEGGGVIYTDGRSTLRADPGGQLSYDRQPKAAQPISVCTPVAIADAARFVADHGGWPDGSAMLWQVRSMFPQGTFGEEQAAPTGIRIQFARVVDGVPLAGPSGPLGLTVDADGPDTYRRELRQVVGLVTRGSSTGRAMATPEEALAALDAAWPAIYPEGHEERRIVDMRVIFYAGLGAGGRQTLASAWSIRLADGDEWVVDGEDLTVPGSSYWRP